MTRVAAADRTAGNTGVALLRRFHPAHDVVVQRWDTEAGTPDRIGRPADQPPAGADYQLRLLGTFGLWREGQPVPVNPSLQRLLAFLATRTRPSTRTAAAEALWPDFTGQRAAANLRSALWRLRRDFAADVIRATGGGVALSTGVLVEVRQVHKSALALSAGDGSVEDLDVAALGQDILPDWPEEWLLPVREWFRQVRLHALDSICVERCRRGSFNAALEAGLLAVACEPLRESAHRAVAQVHLAEGNPAEALRQYDIYRRMLQTELGVPPSPRFRRLVAPLLGRPLDDPA
jgi:DNA-binding SARP family transcriptional activator